MSSEKALETLAVFQDRLSKLHGVQSSSNWEVEWEILRIDVNEWIKSTFATDSIEYRKVKKVLFPGPVIIGAFSNEYRYFLGQAKRLQQSLTLVEHRLTQGQAGLLDETPDEHLIEPGTPHSAYVFLRDIVEGASRLVFLVDPYVDRTLFSLLSNVAAGVEIRILTRPQNVPADFVTEAGKFTQQSGAQLECRVGLDDFHDRFFAIDDRLFFSGASLKDLGKKGSVVGEIQDIKDQIVIRLEKMWQSASALK